MHDDIPQTLFLGMQFANNLKAAILMKFTNEKENNQ